MGKWNFPVVVLYLMGLSPTIIDMPYICIYVMYVRMCGLPVDSVPSVTNNPWGDRRKIDGTEGLSVALPRNSMYLQK